MKRKKSAMTRNLRFVSALDGRTPGAGVEHLERLGTLARLNVRSRRLPFPPCRNPWLNALVPPRRPPCRRSARFSCFSEPAERAVVPASADSSVSERKRSAPGAGSDPETVRGGPGRIAQIGIASPEALWMECAEAAGKRDFGVRPRLS